MHACTHACSLRRHGASPSPSAARKPPHPASFRIAATCAAPARTRRSARFPTMPGDSGLLRLPQLLRALLLVFDEQSTGRPRAYPDLSGAGSNENADLWLAFVIAIVLFAARYITHNCLLSRLLAKRTERERSKLSEGLFYSMYYVAAFAFFMGYVRANEEFLQSWRLFTNEPIVYSIFHPYPPPRSEFVQLYYMQALGFYLSALVFLVMYDTRRSDFRQLVLHHVVTLALIIVSYLYSYTRVGALILALHDFGDIFLYSATSLNKLGYKGIDTAVFAMFAVSFYVTRLVVLPRLVYGVLVESLMTLSVEPSFANWGMYFEVALLHWAVFSTLLNVLVLLHCFWFTLILRMIYRELFLGKKISDEGDIREDDSDGE
jgi:TLC domain